MSKKNLKYKGKNILIFEGRARQSLPLIRAFRKLGCKVTALCSSRLDVAYASWFVNKKIKIKYSNTEFEKASEIILNLVKTGKYDLVVPTTDFSATVLSKNKSEIEKYAKVAVCDYETFKLAENKNLTMKICMENGIPCPKTYFGLKNKEEIINNFKEYPFVIKPTISYGAIGFKVIKNKEELDKALEGINNLEEYVVQEYIPQTDIQYESAMFVDGNNDVKTSVVFSKNRWFPVEGGSSTLNITVDRKDIIDSCTKLLKEINWRGACDIDLIQDPRDNTAKIMEINPRVSGSVKITFDAKTNQALQMLELAFGDEVTKFDNYVIGRRLRCSQTDFLWFIKSKNRFKAKPSWFSCYKTRDQIFYWSDPFPYFAFSLKGLFGFKKEMSKRK